MLDLRRVGGGDVLGTDWKELNLQVCPNANWTVAITLNGAATNFSLTGTIYAPTALVQVNGNGATSFAAQIIAYDVQANGNGGAINVPYGAGVFFHLKGIGLVQ